MFHNSADLVSRWGVGFLIVFIVFLLVFLVLAICFEHFSKARCLETRSADSMNSQGTVGFQRYIDISQTSVALQNFNTFSRFLSTELLLLNNNIKEQSSDIKAGDVLWKKNTHNLDSFLNGVASFHDLDSDLGGFKNPFGGSNKKQI